MINKKNLTIANLIDSKEKCFLTNDLLCKKSEFIFYMFGTKVKQFNSNGEHLNLKGYFISSVTFSIKRREPYYTISRFYMSEDPELLQVAHFNTVDEFYLVPDNKNVKKGRAIITKYKVTDIDTISKNLRTNGFMWLGTKVVTYKGMEDENTKVEIKEITHIRLDDDNQVYYYLDKDMNNYFTTECVRPALVGSETISILTIELL